MRSVRPHPRVATTRRSKSFKEVVLVRLATVIVALLCAVPLLIVAIALGPVIIGILCAVGCTLLVAALVYFVIGLGKLGLFVERTAVRHTRH